MAVVRREQFSGEGFRREMLALTLLSSVLEEEWEALTGTQLFLKQQHLVTEGLDPVTPAPQLSHLFGLQLFRRHGQHCSDPGPSLCGPLQGKWCLRVLAGSWGHMHTPHSPLTPRCRFSLLLACSKRSRRTRSSATSLRVRSSRSASRTRTEETEQGLAEHRDPGRPPARRARAHPMPAHPPH